MQALVSTAKAARLKTTFHRAFDATPDADEALDILIDLGFDRVLTSGIPWGRKGTALDGVERLAATIRRSQGRIEVVLAGGINPANVGRCWARLPLAEGLVSVHAYSGAHVNGQTTVNSVRMLVEATNRSLTLIFSIRRGKALAVALAGRRKAVPLQFVKSVYSVRRKGTTHRSIRQAGNTFIFGKDPI